MAKRSKAKQRFQKISLKTKVKSIESK